MKVAGFPAVNIDAFSGDRKVAPFFTVAFDNKAYLPVIHSVSEESDHR
jgi:hypothetical protein